MPTAAPPHVISSSYTLVIDEPVSVTLVMETGNTTLPPLLQHAGDAHRTLAVEAKLADEGESASSKRF